MAFQKGYKWSAERRAQHEQRIAGVAGIAKRLHSKRPKGDGERSGSVVNPAAFVGPSAAIPGPESEGRRDRPREADGGRASARVDPDEVKRTEGLLYAIHKGLARLTSAPEFELDEQEAADLAAAYANVARWYKIPKIAQKTKDHVELATVLAGVYGMRIAAYRVRKAQEGRPAATVLQMRRPPPGGAPPPAPVGGAPQSTPPAPSGPAPAASPVAPQAAPVMQQPAVGGPPTPPAGPRPQLANGQPNFHAAPPLNSPDEVPTAPAKFDLRRFMPEGTGN